jgi:TPR repeat protein
MDKKYDIFISYCTIDQDIVYKWCNELEKNGIKCWIAQRDIPRGKSYPIAIMDALTNISNFVIFVSNNSIESVDVQNELENASRNKMKIIPVILDDFKKLPGPFGYYLNRLQWIYSSNSTAMDELYAAITSGNNEIIEGGYDDTEDDIDYDLLSIDELIELAINGDPDAQSWLGYYYNYGENVKQSYKKAVDWYIKAAEQGEAGSMESLGDIYSSKDYEGYNLKQATKWYKKAFTQYQKEAENDDDLAQFSLGDLYLYGKGVEQDYNKAFIWYKKSAEQGYDLAQRALGDLYNNTNFDGYNQEKAEYWYRKAAEQGNEYAQQSLEELNSNASNEVDQEEIDYEALPIDELIELANNDDPWAQDTLGYYYENGEKVRKDYNKAFYWHKKAAEQGNFSGQFNLGCDYYEGKGVEQNYEEAFYWLTESAKQGYAEAQLLVGICFSEGYGVGQDQIKAAYWYKLAAEQGNEYAMELLKDLGY